MSATLSLFDRSPVRSVPVVVPARDGDIDGLRSYQREAVHAIRAKLGEHPSTLLVMATGTGKTQTFGAVARHWPGRVLILAHRDELIQQARRRMALMTGEFVGVEQAQQRAVGERIVIGSVQTLSRVGRLSRFAPDHFGLVVADEAHHWVAPSWRRVIEHFSGAKWLGVTATPDRADERAMEQVFASVAYVYDIHDGIRDKWLVPVRICPVTVNSIDLSAVKTTAGDLNQGQLDAVMSSEESLHGVVNPTLKEAGDRRTIVFTTSVDNAHRMAEIFNRYKPGCARAVDGETEIGERRATLRGHQAGEFQFLCNVGVLTEGYDDPAVACVSMGRPTKSRALYAQCIGRGLRPAEGKTDCLVLDFVGNSGRHDLVSALDILGGKWDDEVVAKAKADAKDGGPMSAEEALAKAAADIERAKQAAIAARVRIQAEVAYSVDVRDPFAVLGVERPSEAQPALATVTQQETLIKLGMDIPIGLTRGQASKLIGTAIKRREAGLASFKQVRLLSTKGIPAHRMYFSTASNVITALKANNWRPLKPEHLASIINSRTAGEDG